MGSHCSALRLVARLCPRQRDIRTKRQGRHYDSNGFDVGVGDAFTGFGGRAEKASRM